MHLLSRSPIHSFSQSPPLRCSLPFLFRISKPYSFPPSACLPRHSPVRLGRRRVPIRLDCLRHAQAPSTSREARRRPASIPPVSHSSITLCSMPYALCFLLSDSTFPPGHRPYGPYGPEAAIRNPKSKDSPFQNSPQLNNRD